MCKKITSRLWFDKDSEKAGRVMKAMLEIKEIIIADFVKAYDGK